MKKEELTLALAAMISCCDPPLFTMSPLPASASASAASLRRSSSAMPAAAKATCRHKEAAQQSFKKIIIVCLIHVENDVFYLHPGGQ